MKINVSKVWQVKFDKEDEFHVIEFVRKCQNLGVVCTYLEFPESVYACYADNYNQVVINYDGLLFKCTARPFTKNNSYGYISDDGALVWDIKKLIGRLCLKLPDSCCNCKILPSCPKPCSQKLIENSSVKCVLNSNFTIEDYIMMNFNNHVLKSEK